MTDKNDDQSTELEYQSYVISSVSEELRSFCNDADDLLEPIKDLWEILDDKTDEIEKIQGDEGKEKAFVYQIRLARTAMSLLAEKAKKLSRRANWSKRDLQNKLIDVQQEQVAGGRQNE